ncbi:MAG: DUF1284 domain-containing protein [Oscillospiraceae bacterium]|nr:DUF1284 domain-containing protein [Oscillospiraceae bacterium]
MICLRPHHGLCFQFFVGKGYSPAFVENMQELSRALRETPGQPVLLRCGPDDVCSRCPHCTGSACESGQKVESYDRRVLKLCGLGEGSLLPWRDFSAAVEEKILLPGLLGQVCAGCQWLSFCRQHNRGEA